MGMKSWLTKLAIRWLTKQLREDKDFWQSYKDNIAVCFQDEMKRITNQYKSIAKVNVWQISNDAAEAFMQMWTKSPKS